MRINDISVSRSHAKLKYNAEDGTLLLRDLKSKFGTLILVKKPLKIKEKKIHLQIGRTYIEASLMSMEDFEKLRREKKQKRIRQNMHSQYQQLNLGYGNNQGNNNVNVNNNNGNNNNMEIEDRNDGERD